MAKTLWMSLLAFAVAHCVVVSFVHAAEPLALETKIALGKVAGRIDHLAVDLPRQRLFAAELGNDSVGVIDLKERKLIRTLSGFKRPQGVAYHQPSDTLYVSNAGDGSVRMFSGPDYTASGRINLSDDADNIRIDNAANRIIVGYGDGALAIIDPKSRSKVAAIPLKAHPEGFQLDAKSQRIFVNAPDAHVISVIDRGTGKLVADWPIPDARGHFPMALDEASSQVVVVFRNPPMLRAYAMQSGKSALELKTCGDADDVFVDARRKRLYVICGAGFVDVVDAVGPYKHLARIPTVPGARTGLFVPELDRLFVAVRASGRETAAMWVYRPAGAGPTP